MCQSQNLTFDLSIHLIDHQGEFLFTKGYALPLFSFIDDQLHLSSQPYPECQFRLQQKSYLLRGDDHRSSKSKAVVFGTQILIRHIFSNFYLCIELGQDGNEILKLRPTCNQLCYFQILPQRTFQHKGDYVNFESFFVIRHALYKCYIGSNLLQTGQMRAKMERQLKTSKIKQSYRMSNPMDFVENQGTEQNQSFCLQNMRNFIEDQWEIREELVDELRRTEKKIKDPTLLSIQQLQEESDDVVLPIRTGRDMKRMVRDCAIEKHIHTMWRAKQIQKISHPFLEDNDYVYFISSNKNRGLMNISTRKERSKAGENEEEFVQESSIEFIKNFGENQYICSAIFTVEIVDKDSFYLRHLLTGKYFPFSADNSKKRLRLKPLLPFNCLENKLPPFHLLYENRFYPTSIEDDASTCGFWLNKVNKLQINEILSLQGVTHHQWVPYLLNYLNSNRKRRQQILYQFKFIRFLIQTLINSSQSSKQVYRLLFKMINSSQTGRKEATQYLSSNLLQSNKQFIIDILSQIFDNQMGYVEKYINPQELGYILNDFILEDSYSVIYMRIFRLFCGHHTQPCQRNQNLIFNFFFHSENPKKMMTQSVLSLRKKVEIPKHFKFSLKKDKGTVLFESMGENKPFNELPLDIQQYIRQYYYLLGDCIKLNKESIEIFKQQLGEIYSLDILLDILQAPELEKLKGPILQLLNATYLQPQYRYKLYVFISDYESMCYNGSLIALHRNDIIARMLEYISREIQTIRSICEQAERKQMARSVRRLEQQGQGEGEERVQEEFKSTQFKHLLLMIKFSIENAYWGSQDIVLDLVDVIGRFYCNKGSLPAQSHSNYGQINQWKNYMESTIICIDIATLFIDIQINLALSQLLTLPENKVDEAVIGACARKIEGNEQIRKYFSHFQLCEHENSKLVKKSLTLSRKFYQLRHIIGQRYTKAMDERIGSRNLRDKIQLIKSTLHHIRNTNELSIETCKEYIVNCVPGIRIDELTSAEILRQGYTLNAVCRYRQPSHEFQVLALRLGVLQMLREDLWRYVNLRGKEKPQEQGHIYWKMVLLYVLIKDNKELRREVSNWRRWLLTLIKEDEQRDGQIGLLAIDILEEVYRNWRALIVSDSEQVLSICGEFVRLLGKDNGNYLGSSSALNTRMNKLLQLLNTFLTVDGRKIKNNFQLVVSQLFDKQNIIKCIIKLRNIESCDHLKTSFTHEDIQSQAHNHVLFKLLLYSLTDILEQKPEKIGFALPDLAHIVNLIVAVGRNNWHLTFRIYDSIQQKHLEQDYLTLLRVFRTNLSSGIELIHDYLKSHPDESPVDFKNSPEIRALLRHFPVMVKVAKMAIQHVKFKQQPSNMKSSVNPNEIKLQLVEKLSLLSGYVTSPMRDKLFQMIKANQNVLKLNELDLERLMLLQIKLFSLEKLKNPKISLLAVFANDHLLPPPGKKLYKRWSKLEFGDFYAKFRLSIEASMISSKFRMEEAKEFIRSLIFINKSDSNILDTELKTFFVSFLTSTFPAAAEGLAYASALEHHQELLIDYGTAELITTILQEKYRENRGLFINLLDLANKLLEGGCVASQLKFIDIFRRDHKNAIFENVTTIIQSSLAGIRFYYQQQDGYPCEDEQAIQQERRQVCDILKRAFRFLQLLCENDNQELKKYIYSQTNQDGVVKYMSINFIEVGIYLLLQLGTFALRQLEKHLFLPSQIGENLLEALHYILDFLIEVCQYPAIKNQIYLCNTDFFNFLKTARQLSELPNSKEKPVSRAVFAIQRKIVLLLRGLLQQRNEEIIGTVSKKIQEDDLKYLIVSSLSAIGVTSTSQLQNYLNTKEDKLIEEIENVVDVLIISRVLGFAVLKLFPDSYQQVLLEIDKKIREIEVDFKGQITKIYFCYRPIFDYLSQNTRAFFINRSSVLQSRNQKLRELINSRAIINQDIVNRKSRQLIISENTISYLFTFSIVLCFVLLFMQLFFYSINTSGIALDTLEDSLIHGLAVMEFLITAIYFSLWGINISSITKEKMRTKYKVETITKRSKMMYYWLLLKEIYLQESSSLHATLLFVLSFISCWVDVRLYSLVLLYIFAKIETLSNILTAIRLTWAKLLVVCLLATAFTFVFGFLSINNYVRVLYENESVDVDIGHIESHCTSILTCIDSLYTQRIIGETPSREGETSHYGRFFSDTIHWAFFDILFTNIIAAIIIDKFAQLRNIKEKIDNELRNRCFICYAEKSSIQRKNEDFQEHLSKRHCLWDYFYYLYYLQKLKDHTEYTGIEYWIVRQVKENKIDWFPSDEALKEDDDERKLNVLFELFARKFQGQPLKEGKQEIMN